MPWVVRGTSWFILIFLGVGLILVRSLGSSFRARSHLACTDVAARRDRQLSRYVLFGADIEDGAVQAGGIVSSIVGSIIVLLIYRRLRRGHPARTLGDASNGVPR